MRYLLFPLSRVPDDVRGARSHLICKGFGIIEVLIALLIFSIGLLGVAALQTTALRRNYDAYLHSMAVSQLVNGYERLSIGVESEEVGLWTQFVKELLPKGKGRYMGGKVEVCWFSKTKRKKQCLS